MPFFAGTWGSEEAMHEQRPFQGNTVMTLAKKHYSRKNIDKMVELMEELTLRVISTYAGFDQIFARLSRDSLSWQNDRFQMKMAQKGRTTGQTDCLNRPSPAPEKTIRSSRLEKTIVDNNIMIQRCVCSAVTRKGSLRRTRWVSKNGLLSQLYIKTNILPTQARDKHKENSTKKDRFPQSVLSTTI